MLNLLRTQITNCQNSVEEPGCLRFDLFRSDADPNHLIIEEMYQTAEDAAKHKETAHYLTWRDAVADCMEKPREGMGVTPLFTQRPELRAPYARWSSSAGTVKNSWLGKGDAGEEEAVKYTPGTHGSQTAERPFRVWRETQAPTLNGATGH